MSCIGATLAAAFIATPLYQVQSQNCKFVDDPGHNRIEQHILWCMSKQKDASVPTVQERVRGFMAVMNASFKSGKLQAGAVLREAAQIFEHTYKWCQLVQ